MDHRRFEDVREGISENKALVISCKRVGDAIRAEKEQRCLRCVSEANFHTDAIVIAGAV